MLFVICLKIKVEKTLWGDAEVERLASRSPLKKKFLWSCCSESVESCVNRLEVGQMQRRQLFQPRVQIVDGRNIFHRVLPLIFSLHALNFIKEALSVMDVNQSVHRCTDNKKPKVRWGRFHDELLPHLSKLAQNCADSFYPFYWKEENRLRRSIHFYRIRWQKPGRTDTVKMGLQSWPAHCRLLRSNRERSV